MPPCQCFTVNGHNDIDADQFKGLSQNINDEPHLKY